MTTGLALAPCKSQTKHFNQQEMRDTHAVESVANSSDRFEGNHVFMYVCIYMYMYMCMCVYMCMCEMRDTDAVKSVANSSDRFEGNDVCIHVCV